MSSMACATAAAATPAIHILVFPYPAQGHMLPLLDLTHQLAVRGLQITILITPKNLPILDALLLTHPKSIQTLILPLPCHPKLPSGIENVKDIGNSGNPPIMIALSMLEGKVIQWFQSHPFPPRAILSDFFLGCAQHWAEKLNIPRIAFFCAGAFFTSVFECLWVNMNKGSTSDVVDFPCLPRSPSFNKEQLPSIFRRYKEGDSDMEIIKEGFLANSKSWGYVLNTFYALEREYSDYLKKELCHGKVYSVSPLNTVDRTASMRRISTDTKINCDVFNWLDNCPDRSVLYVCFGSQKMLRESQTEALALGLERSKTLFVWVINPVASQNIPDGFEERISGQGLIIRGWAAQVEILNHKAVGGFLSHCGWNSLLESIMAGVMVLAWPMEADQFANARLLVEYTGLAIRLCEGDNTVPDPDELAQTISKSLGENLPQEEKAKLMREKALEALAAGGSSSMDLDEFVKQLSQTVVPKA